MRFDDLIHFFSLFVNTKSIPLKLNLPDTLIVRDGSLLWWFFTSKDGAIVRKSAAKATGAAIRERFLDTASQERTGDGSYVAVLREASSTPGGRAALLTEAELLAVLERLAAGDATLSCALQVYVRPAGAVRYVSTYVRTARESGVDTFARKFDDRYRPASLASGGAEEIASARLAELEGAPGVPGLLSLELNKATMGVVQYMRRAHALELDGLVCEYLQHHSGRVYLADVLNVSWAPVEGASRPASRAAAASPRPPSAGTSRPPSAVPAVRTPAAGTPPPSISPRPASSLGSYPATPAPASGSLPPRPLSAGHSPPPATASILGDCRPPMMAEFNSELERIKAQTEEYKRKVAALHGETHGMDAEILALHKEASEKEASYRRERDALAADLHEITSAFSRQVKRYNDENAELRNAVEAAEKREADAIRDLRRTEAALAEREALALQERAAAQRRQAEMERALSELGQSLEEERRRREALEANLEALQAKTDALLREKAELVKSIAERKAQSDQLQHQLDKLTDWRRMGRLKDMFTKMAEVAEEEAKRVEAIDAALKEAREGAARVKEARAARRGS